MFPNSEQLNFGKNVAMAKLKSLYPGIRLEKLWKFKKPLSHYSPGNRLRFE
jgi:hypothetical protein